MWVRMLFHLHEEMIYWRLGKRKGQVLMCQGRVGQINMWLIHSFIHWFFCETLFYFSFTGVIRISILGLLWEIGGSRVKFVDQNQCNRLQTDHFECPRYSYFLLSEYIFSISAFPWCNKNWHMGGWQNTRNIFCCKLRMVQSVSEIQRPDAFPWRMRIGDRKSCRQKWARFSDFRRPLRSHPKLDATRIHVMYSRELGIIPA